MKVRIISKIPVRVGKNVYVYGQIADIEKNKFNKDLFKMLETVKEEPKTKEKTKTE